MPDFVSAAADALPPSERRPAREPGEALQAECLASCPDDDQLRRGWLGNFARQDQACFERHILGCAACQRRLDQLHGDDSFVEAVRKHARRLDRASHERDTVPYVSSRLTPPEAHGGARAVAEFQGNERFEIHRRLGAGGMGIVYQAYDRQRREVVALKTLSRLGEAAALRLREEFRASADLRHRNLVSLYELYADHDRRFFTMELLDGDDFLIYVRGANAAASPTRERARNEASPHEVDRLRQALPQLAAGLQALHSAGKLHRDIKPSNVMVTRDGRVVLVDFGLVAEAQADDDADFVVGTAAYMSPEQAAGRALSPASDWYSVGVMLFEALTGELPFVGRAREVMARKQLEEPLPLDYWARDLPADLKALCADLLRADPQARPTADELVRRLSCGVGASPASAICGAGVSPAKAEAGGTPALQLFVGRDDELQALHAAFETTAKGGARVVLLRGPSGVGKTALCAEFFRQIAARQSAILLSGRCYERELVPYKAAESFMESLVGHVERQPPSEIRQWCPPELAAAVHILPVLRRLSAVEALAAEGAAATDDLPDLKRRGFAALRELLRRMTARTPIVFFIDDLQWGDADSPALFAEWLRGPSAPRLLFVGAYRDEAADGGLFLKTWREIERKSGFTWASDELPVGPLAADAAQRLAESLSRHFGLPDGAEAIAAEVAQHAAGHPLFLRELVEHTARSVSVPLAPRSVSVPLAQVNPNLRSQHPDATETVTLRDATETVTLRDATESVTLRLPNLSDMLGRRLAALDADAYRLLEVVAVAGYPITLERAYRAAELSLDRRAALYTLIDANLARTIADDRFGKLVAYHDSVRETFVALSSAEGLRDVHRRLAQAAATEAAVDDEALVLHYQGAGEAELAARHSAAAADRAAGNLAFDLAIRCYRLALESPGFNGEERRALRHKLAEMLAHAGRSSQAGEEYRQLAQAAAGDDRWPLIYESGQQFLRAGMVGQALEMLAPLFQHHGLRPPLRSRANVLIGLLCRRAWLTLTGYRVRPRPFRRSAKRILDQIDVCSRLGGAMSFFDHLSGAALILQGSHLALRSGDDARVALALTMEAVMSALAGKQRRTAKFIARIEVLARRAGEDYALAGAFLARGIGLVLAGDWREALEQFDWSKETVRRCPGKRVELVQAEWYSQYPLFYRGELRQLAERLSDHLQDTLDRQDYFAASLLRLNIGNLAWLAVDRPDDARRQIEEARAERRDLALVPHYDALAAQLRLDLYLGQAAVAWRRLNDEWIWLARSGRLRMVLWAIEIHHLRATIAVALTNQCAGDRAVLRALRRSIRYLQRQPAAWPRALASLSRAGLVAAQGETPAAIAMYQAANELLTEAQMPLYAAAARRRLGELLGDDQLIVQADAELLDRGVANPRRFAALLAGT